MTACSECHRRKQKVTWSPLSHYNVESDGDPFSVIDKSLATTALPEEYRVTAHMMMHLRMSRNHNAYGIVIANMETALNG